MANILKCIWFWLQLARRAKNAVLKMQLARNGRKRGKKGRFLFSNGLMGFFIWVEKYYIASWLRHFIFNLCKCPATTASHPFPKLQWQNFSRGGAEGGSMGMA
jgi:hypothetical protein